MPEIKAAVIGYGNAGRRHAHAYAQIPGVRFVAVSEPDAERAAAAVKEYGVTTYPSYEEMLEQERPDLVSIATKEYFHDGPAIMALEAGANVLCEKIMAHTLDAGEAMVAAAERTGRTLAVDYNYRHMPAFAFIKQRIEAGDIGTPALMVAQTHSYCWHHMLDLMCFYFGYPQEVEAMLQDDPARTPYPWHSQEELLYVPSDAVSASFRFPNGAIATIAATMYSTLNEHMIDLSIYGSKARIGLNRVRLTDTGGDPVPGPFAEELRRLPSVSLNDSFDLSIAAYVAALQERRRPPTTGEDGLAIMRLENAVMRSARENRRVQMEEYL